MLRAPLVMNTIHIVLQKRHPSYQSVEYIGWRARLAKRIRNNFFESDTETPASILTILVEGNDFSRGASSLFHGIPGRFVI